MRKSLLVSAALASGALLCSLGANAIPIKVGLLGASNNTTWTSCPVGGSCTSPSLVPMAVTPDSTYGTVSLSGWENDDGIWNSAYMIKNPVVPGLGIKCNGPDPECTGDQIGSDPQQIIDLNISKLTGAWTGLVITIDSVEGTNTGYLYGGTCTPGADCGVPTKSWNCTAVNGSCPISLTRADLQGITNIWITPVDFSYQPELDPIVLGGSLYVCTGAGPCTAPTAVPEPEALGMFGLGVVLIGTFLGLRRRRFGD
ncbi:MAG TPA: PEP-CTERM sorting domain-containing protein [Rhodanobacteraceae bacterium]|nr:PEP-CTERM sorting domain-containing protein [Rhodanobacteraceae bacterium]